MPISESLLKMTIISESIMSMAHDADMWLRSWQGSLRWKATLALGLIAAIGSLWNVALAEHDEARLHEEVGRHINAGTKPDQSESIEAYERKRHAMHLKGWARLWSAVAIVLSALAVFLKPEAVEKPSSGIDYQISPTHEITMKHGIVQSPKEESRPLIPPTPSAQTH